VGYNYDAGLYSNAIAELQLFEPLAIAAGHAYQIWESVSECNAVVSP